MNWSAQNLTTVDKERIWKEYVAKESDKRGIYDEYRQRATEKTREPEVKISPRGKRFMAKEPYGIQMVMNAEGRMTPVLTDKVLYNGNRGAPSPTNSTSSAQSPPGTRKATTTETTADNSGPTSPTSANNGAVRLPAIQLSSGLLQQAQADAQQQQQKKNPGAVRHSPRKNQCVLQAQYLQNNFSSSTSAAHGGGTGPDAELDRALKNLQFLSTSNNTIGRGTVELLNGLPVNGGCVSPTNSRSGGPSPTNNNNNNGRVGGVVPPVDFGSSLSGTLRASYNQGATSPIRHRDDYVPGSPRSYVVKDQQGGSLFEYGKKQCEITKNKTEMTLTLRK